MPSDDHSSAIQQRRQRKTLNPCPSPLSCDGGACTGKAITYEWGSPTWERASATTGHIPRLSNSVKVNPERDSAFLESDLP